MSNQVKIVSAGFVVLRLSTAGPEVFLIQQRSGRWGLPKGRQEPEEDIMATAVRELMEETGFSAPVMLSSEPKVSLYAYSRNGVVHMKDVYFFGCTLADGDKPHAFPTSEIRDGKWYSMDDAAVQLPEIETEIVREFAALLGA